MDDVVAMLRAEPDRTRRGLLLVALLDEGSGCEPIVVGGFAVEAWTRGGYTTSDVDLISPRPDEARAWLESHGFRKKARHHIHEELGLAVEIPGSVLDEGRDAYDRVVTWRIAGRAVRVLSAEDLIVDRLADFVHGGVTSERENVLRLIAAWGEQLDWAMIEQRAAAERVSDALSDARAWADAHRGPS